MTSTTVMWRSAEGVFAASDSDGTFLVHVATESCFDLNEAGGRMWDLLEVWCTVDEVVAAEQTRWRGDSYNVRTDVVAFLSDLLALGLVQRSDQHDEGLSLLGRRTLRCALRSPSGLMVMGFIYLMIAHLRLVILGFSRAMASVSSSPRSRRGDMLQQNAVVRSICDAVSRGAAWQPRRPGCLQYSLATALLLRRFGIRAAVIVGFRRFPVGGHAWVEIDGRVVNDDRESCSLYTRVFSTESATRADKL